MIFPSLSRRSRCGWLAQEPVVARRSMASEHSPADAPPRRPRRPPGLSGNRKHPSDSIRVTGQTCHHSYLACVDLSGGSFWGRVGAVTGGGGAPLPPVPRFSPGLPIQPWQHLRPRPGLLQAGRVDRLGVHTPCAHVLALYVVYCTLQTCFIHNTHNVHR